MTIFTANNSLGGTAQNMSTAFKSTLALFVTSGSLRRIYIESLRLGASDVPNSTDCPLVSDLSRMTADGTGTAITPTIDTAFETGTQSPALSTAKANYTVEPTVTANSSLLLKAMNQRASWEWVAWRDDARPQAPGVAANGFVLRTKSTNYASTIGSDIAFSE